MGDIERDVMGAELADGLRVTFNPFAFSDEDNQEFLRLGYEPLLIAIPHGGQR